MDEKTLLHRHSASVYFFLVFLISWLGSFLAVGSKFLRGEVMDLSDVGLMAIPMLGGPFAAGILMTVLVDGRDGLANFFSRMKKWNVSWRWYAPLLTFPILLLLTSSILSVAVSSELAPTFVAFGILMGLFAGFLEETGWMGFAFPKMSEKSGLLSASIYLGIIHGFWHIMADFLGNFNTLAGYWLPYFIGFFVHVVALRVLIVWVYANTESLLLSMLMHTCSSGFFVVLIPTAIAPQNWAIFYPVYGVVLWIPAVAVILKYGKNLRA
jgi:membrane protease YdiL (CAAX protease family)